MKRNIFTVIALVLSVIVCNGQAGKNYNNRIGIIASAQPELDSQQQLLLCNTLSDMVTAVGTGSEDNTGVGIRPTFIIETADFVSAGNVQAVVIEASVNFAMVNLADGTIFYSDTKRYKGLGRDRRTAVTQAIASVNSEKQEFVQFMTTGTRRITEYYNSRYVDVFVLAESHLSMNRFTEAMAVLAGVPQGVPYYKEARTEMVRVYRKYVNHKANNALQFARVEFAGGDYASALGMLYDTDLFISDYEDDVRQLIGEIRAKVSEREKREWDLEEKRIEADAETARTYYDAIEGLVDSYYESQIRLLAAIANGQSDGK